MSYNSIPVTVDGTGPRGAIPVDIHGFEGSSGPAGKSAYQIWLDSGNSGTEQDFLRTLRGEDGKEGAPGTPGGRGPAGKDGQNGAPGERGPAGAGIQYAGSFPLLSDLPEDLTLDDAGNFYFTAEFGDVHMWTGTEYKDMAHVVGPEGPKGSDGVDGVDGVDGLDGDPGVKGDPGPSGEGVPEGGLPGQILEKVSSADFDTRWADNEHHHPIVVEGSLKDADSRVSLRLNNIIIELRNTGATTFSSGIRTETGEEVVDYRLDTRFDAAGSDNFTLDNAIITTSYRVVDVIAYSASRNPCTFLLRENGRLWQGHMFVSGLHQERVSVWAQRII